MTEDTLRLLTALIFDAYAYVTSYEMEHYTAKVKSLSAIAYLKGAKSVLISQMQYDIAYITLFSLLSSYPDGGIHTFMVSDTLVRTLKGLKDDSNQ